MCHSLSPDSSFVYGCSSFSLSCHWKKLKALYCDSIPGSPLPDHDLPRWSCIFQTQPCAEFSQWLSVFPHTDVMVKSSLFPLQVIHWCFYFDCYFPVVWYSPLFPLRSLWLDKPFWFWETYSCQWEDQLLCFWMFFFLSYKDLCHNRTVPVFWVCDCDPAAELPVVWVWWHVLWRSPHLCAVHCIQMWSREYGFCYL